MAKTRSKKLRSRSRKSSTRTKRKQRGGGIGAREINRNAVLITKRVERDEGGVEDIQGDPS
jgi:hypothetical protein